MRWKYTKLLMNLGNAVEAICVRDADAGELVRARPARGAGCLRRRGHRATRRPRRRRRAAATCCRSARSTARTAAADRRGSRSHAASAPIEADAFNGEVVRVGTAAGVPTPVNTVIRDRALAAAAARVAPNSIPAAELLAEIV